MDAPGTVAVPLPMWMIRSGSVALQGTSLGDWGFWSQRWLFQATSNTSAEANTAQAVTEYHSKLGLRKSTYHNDNPPPKVSSKAAPGT